MTKCVISLAAFAGLIYECAITYANRPEIIAALAMLILLPSWDIAKDSGDQEDLPDLRSVYRRSPWSE